ncbi:MAG: NAD(P)/FAD-dependent oxidoreductase [Pseudomonadota bacterium]
MSKVAIIGSGAMGLAAAYHAAKAGHEVTLFESDPGPGGMAAHFDFDGLSIEKFYHFVCKTDAPTFEMLEELGISDKMRWVDTKMAYYIDGTIHPWGGPFALLRFPLMSFWQKFRYAISVFRQTKKANFDDLEHMSAREWIVRDCGQTTYDLLWRRLLELKFYEYADNISAAWIATRVKRIGKSRKSMLQETLGYIDGGTQTLVTSLIEAIKAKGGTLHLNAPVAEVTSENGHVTGLRVGDVHHTFDHVISTVPTPLIRRMVPGLTAAEHDKYDAITNIGVVCLLFKLRKKVSENFWLNIIDDGIEIPGIVEFSNLRPTPDTVVYVPYYMPVTHPKWSKDNQAFLDEAFGYLKTLNPDLSEDDVMSSIAARLTHAQPVCEPGFAQKIPPVQTSIEGLQVADTCFYYPEDRGIAESLRLGRDMADAIDHNIDHEAAK